MTHQLQPSAPPSTNACSRQRGGWHSRLWRFWHDRRAVAAVEFALLLPCMLILYIGGNEVGQSIAIYRKVAQVAYTLGDLVTQEPATMPYADLTNIFAAASTVMLPYNVSGAKIVVSGVTFNGTSYKVAWSEAQNGTAWSIGSAPPATVTIPTTLVTNGQQLVVAVVTYTYTSAFTSVMTNIWGSNSITLGDTVYLRPRLANTITCSGCP